MMLSFLPGSFFLCGNSETCFIHDQVLVTFLKYAAAKFFHSHTTSLISLYVCDSRSVSPFYWKGRRQYVQQTGVWGQDAAPSHDVLGTTSSPTSCLICPGSRLSLTSVFQVLSDFLRDGHFSLPSGLWEVGKSSKQGVRDKKGIRIDESSKEEITQAVEVNVTTFNIFNKEKFKYVSKVNINPQQISKTGDLQMALCYEERESPQFYYKSYQHIQSTVSICSPMKFVRNCSMEGIWV